MCVAWWWVAAGVFLGFALGVLIMGCLVIEREQ
jgi:hypothetical protein